MFLGADFRAAGTVRLLDATIGGSLNCGGGAFEGTDDALSCDRANIDGDMFLDADFRAAGKVCLIGATIGGDLDCNGGAFEGVSDSLTFISAQVNKAWHWREVKAVSGRIDLANFRLGVIADDEKSWGKTGEIVLEGFTYGRFAGDTTHKSAAFWKRWLDKQPDAHRTSDFKPQPFEQLAMVLAAEGQEDAAKEIRIHKRQRERSARFNHSTDSAGRLRRIGHWSWDMFLDFTVRFGYRPFRAVFGLMFIWLVGGLWFMYASQIGVMTPTHPLIYNEPKIAAACGDNWVHGVSPLFGPRLTYPEIQLGKENCRNEMPSEYSEFNALFYSLDVAVPILDLRQQADWAPRVTRADGASWIAGYAVRAWEWFEIGAGWILSLLIAASVGGIIRRE